MAHRSRSLQHAESETLPQHDDRLHDQACGHPLKKRIRNDGVDARPYDHRVEKKHPRKLPRIEVNPKIFGGKPIVRGHRIAVEHVLGMLAAGDSPDAILEAYPYLEAE